MKLKRPQRALACALALPIFLISGLGIAAEYQQDFDGFADGTTDLGDGSQMNGTAQIVGGQLQLTENDVAGGFASFNIPALPDSSLGFTATFDLTISDGAAANEPADGMSFNYGNFTLGELGSAEEGMAGVGTVTENLSFEIDTWMNLDAEQGVNIAEKAAGADTNLAFTNGPILLDGSSVTGTVTISWNPATGASFTTTGLDTNADFANVATSFTPSDDFLFGLSGRVGGANETKLIDNLVITTGAPEDSDGDGLPDEWEITNLPAGADQDDGSTNPDFGADGDPDMDGLTNAEELDAQTDPLDDDSDDDGLLDGVEDGGGTFVSASQTGTDPLDPDSDGDTLLDGVEDNGGTFVDANMTGTDPNDSDTDDDGFTDGAEVNDPTRDPNVAEGLTGDFVQEFAFPDGTSDFGDGTEVASNGVFTPSTVGEELQLSAATNDNVTAFHIPAILGSSGGFQAIFSFRIDEPAGGDPPADGFSFSYGEIPVGTTSAQAEEGWPGVPNVLSFEIDTWQNGSAEVGPAIAEDGVDLAFTNGDILANGGSVSGIATISWNPVDGASFTTTGLQTNADFTDVPTSFTGDDAYTFAFAARTGGANENLFIDNLSITVFTDDADGDGLPDIYEEANGLDPNDDGTVGESAPGAKDGPNGALGDPDGDNLTNTEERELQTDPQNADTDGDGLTDDVETNTGTFVSTSDTGTDPLNPDTDGDGLSDGVENPGLPFVDADQPGTDPNNDDTDGDGFLDGTDISLGLDPTVADPAFPLPTTTYRSNFGGYADGTTDLRDGTVIAGTAASIHDGMLRLTQDGVGAGFSSFSIPPLQNSSEGFTATFDVIIEDGPGNNEPADGFSFNYGNASLGELGSAEEGMAGVGAVTENLSFEVDTWMNIDGEQGVNIAEKAGGVDMDLAFTNGPILLDGTRVEGSVSLSWNPNDGASFTTTGLETNADFANVETSFEPDDNHTFIISARVGGANETLYIDNLIVTTSSIDVHRFEVASSDGGNTLDLSWDSFASEFYTLVSEADPESNPDRATWTPIPGQENIPGDGSRITRTIDRPGLAENYYALLAGPAPPLFFDDFESGQGTWVTGVDGGGGSTEWELGTPNGSGPFSGADGSANAFSTNLGNYAPDADVFLQSPPVDLTGVTAASLKYDEFRDADGFGDTGTIRILRAGDMTELATLDPDLSQFDLDWDSRSFDLPAAALGETVIFEFRFMSDGTDDPFSGWSIDNVEVEIQ